MPWVLETSLGREVQLYSASTSVVGTPTGTGGGTLALITGAPGGAQAARAQGAAAAAAAAAASRAAAAGEAGTDPRPAPRQACEPGPSRCRAACGRAS